MKKKKLLSIILAATMIVGLLAGCGNTDGGDSQSGNSDPSPQQTNAPDNSSQGGDNSEANEPTNAVDEAKGLLNIDELDDPNVTIILYWDPKPYEQAAIDNYEAKYGAGTVTVVVSGWNKAIEKINEGIAAGDVPSLAFTEGNACFPKYAVDNYFQPITQYIQDDLGSELMDESAMKNFLYKDEYYVFTSSYLTQPYLIAYYKPLFDDNGLETPTELYAKGQWTWDKFIEYCDLLTQDTDGDGAIDQWGLGPRYKLQNFAYASGIVGIEETGNGTLASHWDDKGMLDYFDFVTKLETIQARSKDADGNVVNDGWLGAGAMYMEAISGELALADDEGNILGNNPDMGLITIPTLDGSAASTPVWDYGYAIPTGAANPQAGAVLGAMILEARKDIQLSEYQSYMRQDELDVYYGAMENIIPQRKNNNIYEGVTMSYGESEAKEGTPAATIIETYKSVVEGEIAAYNASLQ